MSTAPAPERPCHVLLGSLEPTEALTSTIAFLSWCRTQPDAPAMEVLALHPGTAADQVRAVAPTSVVYDPGGWGPSRVAQRIGLQRLSSVLRTLELRRRLRIDGPVYVADAAGGRLLHWLGPAARPVVAHLHASSSGLGDLDPADRQVLVDRADRWIVGSRALAEEATAAGVSAMHITEQADLLTLPGMGELDADFLGTVRAELAERHGIPPDAALVVGIGTVDWWSVPDAFVRVAWETTRRSTDREVHFLWIADGANERMLWPLRHDIRHAGLDGRVHVDTANRPMWHLIAAADVLVSSRLGEHEPIGHREAARIGRPVIWFDDPEAAEQLVEPSQGTAVAHLDVDAMADAVLAALAPIGSPTIEPATSPAGAPWLPAVGGRAILDLLVAT